MRVPAAPLFVLSVCFLGIVAGVSRMSTSLAQGDEVASSRFNQEIRPILSEHCFTCHGPDEATREAGLRLDQAESAAHVIDEEFPQESALGRRVMAEDPGERMPPPEVEPQPTVAERQTLADWIEAGAAYEPHWAFVPPRVRLPDDGGEKVPQGAAEAADVIDRFVASRRDQVGLAPSPPADWGTLFRRVTFDLTGLPPAPEAVQAFLRAPSEPAYVAWIDRLMASPRYGERMALPWLEAARYADTDGYQNDRYRYMSAWRDWVIKAFNTYMPYDQFVIEQLAGDMLPEATLSQQIATGFGRNHRINSEDGSIPEEWRVENVVDRTDTFGTVFLGMTVGCARCHDHKYDPISQQDYYRLFAYFNNIAEWGIGPNNGNSPPFVPVPEDWPYLDPAEDRALEPEPLKLHRARKEAGNGLQRPQAGSPQTTMVMQEREEPRETYLLVRGQYNAADRSQPLQPGVPKTLAGPVELAPQDRLELARWLVDPQHPLTARVAVNRFWQHLFGRGLVESSENFGSQGKPPSHPALLDWLAMEFIRSGWDIQHLQKTILLSRTYRQASAIEAGNASQDTDNRWLARGPRRRLSGFALRDQALAASGLLVEQIGGPSVKPYMPPNIWKAFSNNKYVQDHGAKLYRRSLYTYWRRTIPPPTMMTFNAAGREVCAVRTEQTNTPLQALTLMNNKSFVEASRFLAERMLREGGSSLSAQLERGFWLVCGRAPSHAEQRVLHRAHADFAAEFAKNLRGAKQLLETGETPRDATIDPQTHAAMTMTASLLLNLEEAITLD
jgi:cytochrome c553